MTTVSKLDLMRDDGTDSTRFESGMRTAMVMMSGGIDSSALAYWVAKREKFDSVTAFFTNLGVANSEAEYNSVNRTCLALGFRLVEGDFRWVRKALGGVVPAFEDDPELIITMLGEHSRKSVMPTTGCAVVAETTGCFDMFHGSNKDDLKRYTFIPESFRRIEEMMSLGNRGRQFTIHRPFADLTNRKVLALAKKLGVPLENTWSCVASSAVHCGICMGCTRRKARLGDDDATKYLK